MCTSCADLTPPPSLPPPPCGAFVCITLAILTLLYAVGGGVSGWVGVGGVGCAGWGGWGKSVELPRCILFICIFTLFSLREVISFSNVVLFLIGFLAPPPASSLPPQYLSVLCLLSGILSV